MHFDLSYAIIVTTANANPFFKKGYVLIAEGNLYGEYTYNAPSNNVIVYPSDATLPEGAPTTYKSGESTALPDGAPASYTRGETVTLPTLADKEGLYFHGWYIDEALTIAITEVPNTASGEFKVYAKWSDVAPEPAPDEPEA